MSERASEGEPENKNGSEVPDYIQKEGIIVNRRRRMFSEVPTPEKVLTNLSINNMVWPSPTSNLGRNLMLPSAPPTAIQRFQQLARRPQALHSRGKQPGADARRIYDEVPGMRKAPLSSCLIPHDTLSRHGEAADICRPSGPPSGESGMLMTS